MANNNAAPHGDTNPSALLRRISVAGHGGVSPEPDDMLRIAIAFDRMSNGEAADIALGLKPKPGQRTLRTLNVIDHRNRLLREAAKRFLGRLPVAVQAQHIHVQLTRYQTGPWTRERICAACPDRHKGTIHEFLWAVLKLHDCVLAVRTLRLILATSQPLFVAS